MCARRFERLTQKVPYPAESFPPNQVQQVVVLSTFFHRRPVRVEVVFVRIVGLGLGKASYTSWRLMGLVYTPATYGVGS